MKLTDIGYQAAVACTPMSNSSPVFNIDQMIRAFLLANATATLLWLSVAFFLPTHRV